MSLDVYKPTDQVLVSELPEYIRETRQSVNEIISGDTEITTTNLELSSGQYVIVTGTDVTAIPMEKVLIKSLGPAVLEQLTGGTEGQIKVFIGLDNDVYFKDGVKSDGKFYLNQLPTLSNFQLQEDDVLMLMNIGGDGALVNGYWKEIYRSESVK